MPPSPFKKKKLKNRRAEKVLSGALIPVGGGRM
jgi:hypothetical protein